MKGMNAQTGRAISGNDHLCQSIAKILTTPIVSRVQRRPFGSELPNLVDAPNNPATRVRLYAATAAALMQWEPRIKLMRVRLADEGVESGVQVIDIEGVTAQGDTVSTSVALSNGGAA